MDGFLPVEEDSAIELSPTLIADKGEHVGQKARVHAEEGVQVDGHDVARPQVRQIAGDAAVVDDVPARAKVPARLGARFEVGVQVAALGVAHAVRRLVVLPEHRHHFQYVSPYIRCIAFSI